MDPTTTSLIDVLARVKEQLLAFLPGFVGAVALFVVGLILARVLRVVVARLLHRLSRSGPAQSAWRLRPVRLDPSVVRLVSGLVYWMVVLLFLTASTEMLKLPVVATWLSGIANYLPRLLTATLIGAAGLVGAGLLRDGVTRAASSFGIAYAEVFGRLTQGLVILLSVLIAVDLMGLDVSFLINVIYIVMGSLLFAASLAFGLGSRAVVGNILASYYLQKSYKVGQTVRIGPLEGRIIEITPTAVVLQAAEEQVLVPAKMFSETSSSILPSGA